MSSSLKRIRRTALASQLHLVCFTLALLISCGGRRPVNTVQNPHVFDDQGVHVVTHASGTCTACSLYHKLQNFIVLLDSAVSIQAGVVLTAEGTVITSAQIAGKASSVEVTSREFDAWIGSIVAQDSNLDLALVALPQLGQLWSLPELHQGPPPPVGTEVFLVGYPIGLGWCVMHGEITGTKRVNDVDMIETDATYLPGNSGGALVDASGRLIGIVSSIPGGNDVRKISLVRPTATALAYLHDLESELRAPSPENPQRR